MIRDLEPGTVTLVGGGPGDPGLITVQGLHAIRQADVVVYDRLAPLECLAEARPEAELIEVGKIPRGPQTRQERISEIMIQHAWAGRAVVRLKGGDSFVFGRGGEEWQACAAAGVPVHVVPGVTSAVAVPELAGIPVTHRSLTQGFTVVSGHVPPGDPVSYTHLDVYKSQHPGRVATPEDVVDAPADPRSRPLVLVHTGEGKGKTTAAMGLALRGWAQGWSIGVVQFIKSGKWPMGERAALLALGRLHEQTGQGGPVHWYQAGAGWTWSRPSTGDRMADAATLAADGWARAAQLLAEETHDLLILDELTYPCLLYTSGA